jgi:hypothetical protein
MRTVITETDVFEFEELSSEAKEKAIQYLRESEDFEDIFEEVRGCINAIEKEFSCFIDYQYGLEGIRKLRVDGDNGRKPIAEYYQHLLTKNYPFTGIYYDEQFLDAVRKVSEYDTEHEMIVAGMDNLLSSAVKDMEYRMSDEYIKVNIEANDYEFTADGVIY